MTTRSFRRDALLIAAILASLAALQIVARKVYAIPGLRLPAMMFEVMSSRLVTFNTGFGGYYERLLSPAAARQPHLTPEEFFRSANESHDHIYSSDFRLVRLRPHLDRQVEMPVPGQGTNSYGFVGPEWPPKKPPNTRRVALLGDSVAQGMGVDLKHVFGTLLEQRLNLEHAGGGAQRFEVLNFAVGGYPLTQNFDVAMEEVPRFEPDVYMLALTQLAVYRDWDMHLVRVIQLGIDLKYEFIRETVRESGASEQDDLITIAAKLEPFRISLMREMLAKMKSHVARDHATFIVLLVPAVVEGDLDRRRFGEIPAMLDSLNIVCVDLLDTFDRIPDLESLRVIPADAHPNAKGHALLAENLYAKLKAQPRAWAAIVGTGAENAPQPRPR